MEEGAGRGGGFWLGTSRRRVRCPSRAYGGCGAIDQISMSVRSSGFALPDNATREESARSHLSSSRSRFLRAGEQPGHENFRSPDRRSAVWLKVTRLPERQSPGVSVMCTA